MKKHELIYYFLILVACILISCKKEALKTAPVVSITTVSNITTNSALSGGNVSADGGASVTSRGVCWSTGQNPTTADSKTSDGSGVGSFSSSITGLNPGVSYTLRAYAINSVGTAYSSSTSFTTTALTPPTLTTTDASALATTSASSGGNVSSDGGSPVTARGVCWGIISGPTLTGNKTSDGNGTGNFSSSISGLTPGTIYYVRAYATNSAGTAYGNETTFTTKANLSTITTITVSSITSVTATGGGNISSDGGGAVTARGVCWSTTSSPTVSNSKTTDGSGTGSFTSQITGLSAGTLYYVRSYATNSAGTVYGNEVTFSASAVPATITTTVISNITATTASGGGNITLDGGAAITARGVCWSTTSSPTIANSKTTDATGTGNFTSSITGLNGNTTYYVRAYATNSQGTAYGNEVNFKTNLVLSPASLTTSNPSSISNNSALLGGNISSDGNATVTERGVCYSTSQTPTTGNTKVGVGTGIGTFSTTVSGLTSNTTYYVRAYAINSQGTAYGNELNFKTNIVISLASLTTAVPTSVTCYSMVMGGNVTSDGNATVTDRGVCYSTSQNPTTSSPKLSMGSGTGTFSNSVSGLSANTTYYIRAYAINNQGTAYGLQVSVTTAALPVVTTNAISAFTSSTATTGGNVINDSGASITSRGVCWSTTQSPTTANNISTNGSGIGGFTSNLTGLSPNTTYYVRAFATNSNGTAYGNQVVFTTDPITVSDIDGNSYKVIRIGTQLWTAENLKTTTYNDGTVIPMVSGNSAWINLYSAAYCWYNNDPGNNKNIYGALYNWWVVETGKLCPTGWSVSSQDDWTTIDAFLDPNSGGKIKETGTAHWNAPNTGATNETGFSALAGGYRSGDWNSGSGGYFGNLGYDAFFWTRDSRYTGSGSVPDFYIDLDDTSGTIWNINYAWQKKNHGFSVRCVKN